jgi:hypothetical protein
MINNNLKLSKKHNFHYDAVYGYCISDKHVKVVRDGMSSKSFDTSGLDKYKVIGRNISYDSDSVTAIDEVCGGITFVYHVYKNFLTLL